MCLSNNPDIIAFDGSLFYNLLTIFEDI
ncbi:unnamed protein product, partial [Rotaria sp. Silwood1]